MCRVASAPNPVEMPYAGVGAAASSSTTARPLAIASSASSVRDTAAPSRATATTSEGVTGAMPMATVVPGAEVGAVVVMAPSNSRPPPATSPRPRAASRISDSAGPPFSHGVAGFTTVTPRS